MKNKWTLKQLAFMLILLLHPFYMYAQETVGGIVMDGNGNPLPGVAITVKNTPGIGVVTETDGTFNIKVKHNDILVFTYLGLLTQYTKKSERNGCYFVDFFIRYSESSDNEHQ